MTITTVTINAKDLIKKLEEFGKKNLEIRDEVLREVGNNLANRIIKKTPVDTGLLRGSWKGGINSPNTDMSSSSVPDASLLFAGAKWGDTLFISNSQPYAVRIEFGFVNQTDSLGRTFSGPAPANMIRGTLPFFDLILQESVNKVNAAGVI